MNYLDFVQLGTEYWGRGAVAAMKFADDPIAQHRWPDVYAKLLAKTNRAILPNGAAYPIVWGRRGTLLGTRLMRIINFLDVVDRTGPALEIKSGTITAGENSSGLYWTASGPLTVDPFRGSTEQVISTLSSTVNSPV